MHRLVVTFPKKISLRCRSVDELRVELQADGDQSTAGGRMWRKETRCAPHDHGKGDKEGRDVGRSAPVGEALRGPSLSSPTV